MIDWLLGMISKDKEGESKIIHDQFGVDPYTSLLNLPRPGR